VDCSTCPLKPKCTKAKGKLLSEQGIALSQLRSVEVKTVFGDIKNNWGFCRFMLRGLINVDVEWVLVCMAHNLQKIGIL
jgi:hypothetical protein